MKKIIEDVVMPDGMKQIKILHSPDVDVRLIGLVPLYLLRKALHVVEVEWSLDLKARTVETVVRFPVCGPVDMFSSDGKSTRCFVVHRRYGKKISDCLRLAVDGWTRGTRQAPQHGYVLQLPAGVEAGVMVHGVDVYEAEWMLKDCVAVK